MAEVTTTPIAVAHRDEGFLFAGISASATTITVGAIYKTVSGVRTKQGFDSTGGFAEITFGDTFELISFGAKAVDSTTKVTTLTDVRRGLSVNATTQTLAAGTGKIWPKGARIAVVDSANYFHSTAFKDKANTFTDHQTLTTTKELRLGGSDRAIYDDGTEVYFKSGTTSAKSLATLAAAAGTDEKSKVSLDDTTSGYLASKITGGDAITVTETNGGGNETLDIDVELAADPGLELNSGALRVKAHTGITRDSNGISVNQSALTSVPKNDQTSFFNAADSAALTNPTSETTFDTTKQYTITANNLAAGVGYEFEIAGTITMGTAGDIAIKPALGATTFGNDNLTTANTGDWVMRGTFFGTAAAGASVAVRCAYTLTVSSGATGETLASYSTANVATNGSLVLAPYAIFFTSNGSNSITATSMWARKMSTSAF